MTNLVVLLMYMIRMVLLARGTLGQEGRKPSGGEMASRTPSEALKGPATRRIT